MSDPLARVIGDTAIALGLPYADVERAVHAIVDHHAPVLAETQRIVAELTARAAAGAGAVLVCRRCVKVGTGRVDDVAPTGNQRAPRRALKPGAPALTEHQYQCGQCDRTFWSVTPPPPKRLDG